MSDVVQTTWGELDEGALIMDADGRYWRLGQRRVKLPQVAFWITDGERSLWSTHFYEDEVVLVDEAMGQAVLTVMKHLPGSEVIIGPLPHGPDKPWVKALYAAHLLNHHGTYAGDKQSLDSLIEAHAVLHADAAPAGVKHTHRRL